MRKCKKILFGVLAIATSVMLSAGVTACNMSGANGESVSSTTLNSSNAQNDGNSSTMNSESGSSDNKKNDSSFDDSDYETECVVYTLSEDGLSASVTGYTGLPTKVKILSTYQGVPVTSIDEWAFGDGDCSRLTSVVIGDSVTSIGDYAFVFCSDLTNVVIGVGLMSIGDFVFQGCSSLTNIDVSENNVNYKSIDGNLYSKDGTTLVQYAIGKTATEFVIGDSVTSIGGSAFLSCSGLTSVVIPDSVTNIDYSPFSGCSSLTIYCEVQSKPSGWGSLDFWLRWNDSCPVVWDCKNNDVATNGYIYIVIDGIRYAISDGEAILVQQPHNIGTANIPASITYKNTTYLVTCIGWGAFRLCSSLTSIEIPNSVTGIGGDAFEWCSSLTSVVIPDSVTDIGDYAFYNCSSLTSVVIPYSVTSIDEAFRDCNSLTSVYYKGTESEWNKIDFWRDNDYLTSAMRYYYSEEEPTEEGNYWHYVDGVVTKW